MFTLRLALLISLLFTFTALTDDGVGIDPHGGRVRATSDRGAGLDPNGGTTTASAVSGDKGLGVDPNG